MAVKKDCSVYIRELSVRYRKKRVSKKAYYCIGKDVSNPEKVVKIFHKEMQKVRPRFENLYDPLGLLPELQADRVRLDPSSAKSSGLEVSLDGEYGDWLWWGSYTLSKARDRIAGNSELRSWDQRHAVQGGLRWSHKAWDVALAAGVHTGWPTTDLTRPRATGPLSNAGAVAFCAGRASSRERS